MFNKKMFKKKIRPYQKHDPKQEVGGDKLDWLEPYYLRY